MATNQQINTACGLQCNVFNYELLDNGLAYCLQKSPSMLLVGNLGEDV